MYEQLHKKEMTYNETFESKSAIKLNPISKVLVLHEGGIITTIFKYFHFISFI